MKWHVFPAGRMCSIRRAMLLWLVPLFLAVGAFSAVVSYWSFSRMVSTFMDEQMQQLATALSDHPTVQPPQQDADRILKWGAYVVQTYDPTGRLQKTSWPELRLPLQAAPGFHDVRDEGRTWRVYTLQSRGVSVQIAQPLEVRSRLAAQAAWRTLAPFILVLPLLAGFVWFAVTRGLKPLAPCSSAR